MTIDRETVMRFWATNQEIFLMASEIALGPSDLVSNPDSFTL